MACSITEVPQGRADDLAAVSVLSRAEAVQLTALGFSQAHGNSRAGLRAGAGFRGGAFGAHRFVLLRQSEFGKRLRRAKFGQFKGTNSENLQLFRRVKCLCNSLDFQSKASDGIRTHDLPITNRLHYLCATLAMEGRDKRM